MIRSGFGPRTKTMARSTVPLHRTAMKKTKPKPRAGHDKKMLDACRGEVCWLSIPGVCRGDVATVVPAHRNEGKGMGLKVADKLTVPACFHCHTEYDSGMLFTREEKRGFFDGAMARWAPVRDSKLIASPAAQIAGKEKAALAGGFVTRYSE